LNDDKNKKPEEKRKLERFHTVRMVANKAKPKVS